MPYFFKGVCCSENLYNLCVCLEKQHNIIAEPKTFSRTYAGKRLLSGGAFSWTMRATMQDGYKTTIGSQEPLSAFKMKNTIVTIDRSWRDVAIWSDAAYNYIDK
jgi:hypothetical protein